MSPPCGVPESLSMSMFASSADYFAAKAAKEAQHAERQPVTKVLFLDIDGVLNCERTRIAFDGIPHLITREHVAMLDQVAIGMIRALCEHANIGVVISSSWRSTTGWQCLGRALRLPTVDQTPRLAGCRGDEIARWLAEHPEVDTYAILDDSSDMLDGQLSRFVRTCGFEGMTWANFKQLCAIFSVDPYDCSASRRRAVSGESISWSGA